MDDLPLDDHRIEDLINTALREDFPHGDLTTDTLIAKSLQTQATITAKGSGMVAGASLVQRVYQKVDPSVVVTVLVQDGTSVQDGTQIIRLQGNAATILTGERVALNFLQHLSGIATLTARFCNAVKGYSVTLLDTRKTTPGLRSLEKWAVKTGGGTNHRMSLSDGILIKDNHLAVLQKVGTGIAEACRLAKSRLSTGTRVFVEVESLDQIPHALAGKPDVILLDNMSLSELREAVRLIHGQALTEVSGGVTLENVREIAATGVDSISIGSLTHSAPAMDYSLTICPDTSAPQSPHAESN